MKQLFSSLIMGMRFILGEAGVVATASTLADLDAAALSRIAWRTKVKEDSVRNSIWTSIKTAFSSIGSEMIITDHGIILDITNEGKAQVGGGQSVRCALRTPLRKAPREGNAEDLLGNEDETGLLYATFYYNEIKKGVKMSTYGYDANDLAYLKYNETYSKWLGLYWQELEDLRYQTALLLGFSNELTKAPVSQVQCLNPNWCIPGIAPSSYPSWATTAVTTSAGSVDADSFYSSRSFSGVGTVVENIAAALIAAGTAATPKLDNLFEIFSYVEDEHLIEPIMLDGQPSYIFKIPTRDYNWLMNPANSGSIGEYIKSVVSYKDEKRPLIPGEVGRIMGSFVVVKDPRCPTITVGGGVGTYTITPGFIRPGNNDDRNRSAWSSTSGATNYAFDCGAILGAEALAVYNRDELVTDLIETTEYKKREGRGSYKGSGIQLCKYDRGTPTSSSLIYRGSCIVPFCRVNVRAGA